MKIEKIDYQYNIPTIQSNLLKELLDDRILGINILNRGTFQEYIEYLDFVQIQGFRNRKDYLLNDIRCLVLVMKSGKEISIIYNEESNSASVELRLEDLNVVTYDRKYGDLNPYYKQTAKEDDIKELSNDWGGKGIFNFKIAKILILKLKRDKRHTSRPYEKGILFELENNLKILIGSQVISSPFDFTISIVDRVPDIVEVVMTIHNE